jgi:hypothetical protein
MTDLTLCTIISKACEGFLRILKYMMMNYDYDIKMLLGVPLESTLVVSSFAISLTNDCYRVCNLPAFFFRLDKLER